MRLHLRAIAVAATIALTGCSVGPPYRHPESALPAHWRETDSTAAIWPTTDWWRGFNDPQLDALIARAESQNLNLAAAVARVREANADTRIAGAALLPSIGATAEGTQARTVSPLTPTAYDYHEFDLGVNASYEIDFWGENRAALQAAKASAAAARYDQQVIALATVSGVASTYFQALGLRDEIAVAENNLTQAEQMLAGIHAEFNVGTVAELNIVQQETVVDSLRASIPPLRQQLAETLDALAILEGENPENIKLGPRTLLDLAMPAVAPGLPAALLERRPDVQEAEANLIAANADIRVARAEFFPSVTLTGEGGMETLGLAAFSPPTAVSALAAAVTAPIFEGGRLRGQLEYSKARYTELLDDYRQSIISALGNVEDALAGVHQTGEQLGDETATVGTARQSYQISEALFQGGTADMVNVLTAEAALFGADQTLVQVRLAHAQALVSLFQALGGGWKGGSVQEAVAGQRA
ncbi:MAG TPA: efflux transporter outer membrane subunit [Acetobacteraceae bacterium]|nr:efflux transporter outer membrane subunit [Acetobacteraceae bacterium]